MKYFFSVLKLLFNDILQGFSIFQETSDGYARVYLYL